MHAKGIVEPAVRRIDLFDDLSWREHPEHTVVPASIAFVKVDSTAGRVPSDVSVVTLKPTDLIEHDFIGDVGRVVGVVCVGCRDVDDGNIGRPFRANLEQ